MPSAGATLVSNSFALEYAPNVDAAFVHMRKVCAQNMPTSKELLEGTHF